MAKHEPFLKSNGSLALQTDCHRVKWSLTRRPDRNLTSGTELSKDGRLLAALRLRVCQLGVTMP